MAQLNFDVSVVARYRPIVPFLAYTLSKLIPFLNIASSFYIINSQLILFTSLIVGLTCFRLGLNLLPALIAPILFISSRTISIVVGTPHVDSLYFLSLSVLFYLYVTRKYNLLLCLMPFLVISKETLPIFFLFLFFAKKCNSLYVAASYLSSVTFSSVTRHYLDKYTLLSSPMAHTTGFLDIISSHIVNLSTTLPRLLTLEGLFDLFSVSFGLFTILVPFAIHSHIKLRLPISLDRAPLLVYPIFLFLSLISGNLGRTFFATFPITIPLILAFLVSIIPTQLTLKNQPQEDPLTH